MDKEKILTVLRLIMAKSPMLAAQVVGAINMVDEGEPILQQRVNYLVQDSFSGDPKGKIYTDQDRLLMAQVVDYDGDKATVSYSIRFTNAEMSMLRKQVDASGYGDLASFIRSKLGLRQ